MKQICRCGAKLDTETDNHLVSYFRKTDNIRITFCKLCAQQYGMDNEDKYIGIPYHELNKKYANLLKEI